MTECVLCTDAITNPLCPGCLVEEMLVWAQEHPEALHSVKQELHAMKCFDGTTSCLKCGNSFSICTYCFTEQVKENIEYDFPDLAEEFSIFFDFREVI